MANAKVQGNNAIEIKEVKKGIEIISPKRERKLQVITCKSETFSDKKFKRQLRKQHKFGWLCIGFTVLCFALGATILPEAATLGLFTMIPGVALTASRHIW